MTPSSASPDDRRPSRVLALVRRRARCRAAARAMPITPLSGVRISWLMLARNSDFARDASIAWLSAAAALGDVGAGGADVRDRAVGADPAGVLPRDRPRRAVGGDPLDLERVREVAAATRAGRARRISSRSFSATNSSGRRAAHLGLGSAGAAARRPVEPLDPALRVRGHDGLPAVSTTAFDRREAARTRADEDLDREAGERRHHQQQHGAPPAGARIAGLAVHQERRSSSVTAIATRPMTARGGCRTAPGRRSAAAPAARSRPPRSCPSAAGARRRRGRRAGPPGSGPAAAWPARAAAKPARRSRRSARRRAEERPVGRRARQHDDEQADERRARERGDSAAAFGAVDERWPARWGSPQLVSRDSSSAIV